MSFDRSSLEKREHCPLCSSSDQREQFVLDGFHIVACGSCGFKYVVEVAGEDANAAYYEQGYTGERHRQGQEVNASINIKMLRSLGDFKGKSLLDIGSGFGFLVARARDELKMSAYGCELSTAERDWATNNLKVDSFASLSDIPNDRKFDVVSMFEVIEHVRQPLDIIDDVSRLLKPGGTLVIGTDNFDSAAVRGMGTNFPKWIPHQHISLFAPASLKRAGEMRGHFRSARTLSYTPWEFWARLAVIRATRGRSGGKTFKLTEELGSEDDRGYKLFPLRRGLNALYARYSRHTSLKGSMMYAAFKAV